MGDYINELYKKYYRAHIDMLSSNVDIDLNQKRSKIIDYLPKDMSRDFWEMLILDSLSSFRCGFLAALTPAIQIVTQQGSTTQSDYE